MCAMLPAVESPQGAENERRVRSPASEWPEIRFRVPVAWKNALDEICYERAISISDLMRQLLREFLRGRFSGSAG
jgi:hypothetical protein